MLEDFLAAIIPSSTNALDTRKIDRNIEILKKYPWFKHIYDDEQYSKLFLVNRNVRKYLQSTFHVKRIIKNEEVQKDFIDILNNQLKR